MLSNFDLAKLAKGYNIPLNGIVMRDELDDKEAIDGNYIINMASSTGRNSQGTHWVALTIQENEAMYFDSFGAVPSQNVIDFVKQIPDVKFGYNNSIIQDLKNESCGFYCIAFLVYLNQTSKSDIYLRTNGFIKMFKNNTKLNDKILKKYLEKYGNTSIKTILKKL